jgi:hypothetical protein
MMNAFTDILKSLAPTVASALLGPLGGMAVAAIGQVIGLEGATTESITKAFAEGKITPEHLAEIKKLELQYQNDEKERGFKYVELEFKDRDSARQMQIATKSEVPAYLTFLITVGFFGILGWMLSNPTISYPAPIMVMLGSLGTAWIACIQYWFGTTRSSSDKTTLLAQAQPIK